MAIACIIKRLLASRMRALLAYRRSVGGIPCHVAMIRGGCLLQLVSRMITPATQYTRTTNLPAAAAHTQD